MPRYFRCSLFPGKSLLLALLLTVMAGHTAPATAMDNESRIRGIHMQSRSTSCGFAALATILSALGDNHVSESALIESWVRQQKEKDQTADISDGVRLDDLRDLAVERGYPARLPKVRAATLHKLKRPVIVLLRRPLAPAHIVVLKGFSPGRVHLADPSVGHIVMDEASFIKEWATDGEGVLLVVGSAQANIGADSPLSVGAEGIEELSLIEAMLRDAGRLGRGQRRTTLDLSIEKSTSTFVVDSVPVGTRMGSMGSALAVEYGVTNRVAAWMRLPLERVQHRVRVADSDEIAAVSTATTPSFGVDIHELSQKGLRPAISWGLNVRPGIRGQAAAFGGHGEANLVLGNWRLSADLGVTHRMLKGESARELDANGMAATIGVRHQFNEAFGITATATRELLRSRVLGANDLVLGLGADIRLGRTFFIRPTVSHSFGTMPTRAIGITFGWMAFD